MMNVQRMRQIVDVTADGGLPEVVLDAARRWRGESLTHVRSSGNHIFRLVLTDGSLGYLRLAPVAERSRASLDAEMEFVQHVARAGVAVAQPIPSESGSLVEEVHDRGTSTNTANDDTSYHAVVFEGLRGRQLEHEELTQPHYRAWGRRLAQLHDASQTFSPRASRASWLDEIRRVLASLPESDRVVARVLNEGVAWLDTMPTDPESYGLLHGDCELDNLVWDVVRPQVLDFDSAVYAPYIVDVAIALQEVWSAETPHRDDHVAWLLDGYRELRPLPPDFLETLPCQLNLLAAFKVAQLMAAYAPPSTGGEETRPTADDPPWLENMRARHQRWLAAQRAFLERD